MTVCRHIQEERRPSDGGVASFRVIHASGLVEKEGPPFKALKPLQNISLILSMRVLSKQIAVVEVLNEEERVGSAKQVTM